MAEALRTSEVQTERRYLRVEDLRRLRHLVFAARRPIEGQYAGRHASPQRGHSVEFSDYRQYSPGDEIGDIDWKVYGRSDKLFIKVFEHQTDLTVSLLVDASASMAYRGLNEPAAVAPADADDGGGASWLGNVPLVRQKRGHNDADGAIERPSKYDHSCLMAAAIAFLITEQQDKVAFGVAQNGLQAYHEPVGAPAHLQSILHAMAGVESDGEAHLAEAIRELARRARRRGLLILFSDLLEEPDPILRALSAFTGRGSEVIVFHTLHAEELHLPELTEAIFVDSETDQRVRLNVDDVTPAYRKRLKVFLDGWALAFRARGIDYNLVSTDTPYDQALARYLLRRASMTG